MKLSSQTAHVVWPNRLDKQCRLFAGIRRILPAFLVVCLLLSSGATAHGAEPVAPFNRMMYLNDWGTLSSEAAVQTAIDECAYMNADAISMTAPSDYFEAVRDPVNRGYWDPRASWDMVGKAIDYAHSKGIQMNVWIAPTIVNSWRRAEERLFGDQYRVVYRDGSINTTRNDLAFKTLADYEIGLLSFIAQRYPKLDGIHLEETAYYGGTWNNYATYSTGMRDRIEAKYGYDPMTRPEAEMIPIIHNEMRLVLNEFYGDTKAALKAINPDIQFSANGAEYDFRGMTMKDINDGQFFDWYGCPIYDESVAGFEKGVTTLCNNLPDVAKVVIAGITWASIDHAANEAFLEQVERSLEFGADAEGVFSHYFRNKIIDGETVMEGLHDLIPVPEPTTMAMLAVGGMLLIRRRRSA